MTATGRAKGLGARVAVSLAALVFAAGCHDVPNGGVTSSTVSATPTPASDLMSSVTTALPSPSPSATPQVATAVPTAPAQADLTGLMDVQRVADGLPYPVSLAFGPAPAGSARAGESVLYVGTDGLAFPSPEQHSGAIYWLDGATPRVFASGLDRPLGLLWLTGSGRPELLVSTRGQVTAWADTDGDGTAERQRMVLEGLPSFGLHQNNSLVLGPDGLLYMPIGTRTNADAAAEDTLNGTIVRFQPDGTGLDVFARGFRNPFDLAFAPDGTLFATDNGVDPPTRPEAPDELDLVQHGGFYGHPFVFGAEPAPPDQAADMAPLTIFPPHSSADGILQYTGRMFPELDGQLLVAEFGSYLAGQESAGRRISRVVLTHADGAGNGSAGWTATVAPLLAPFPGRPLDLAQAPDGSIYVADLESDAVWRLVRRGSSP